jgi:hypothetical protein
MPNDVNGKPFTIEDWVNVPCKVLDVVYHASGDFDVLLECKYPVPENPPDPDNPDRFIQMTLNSQQVVKAE